MPELLATKTHIPPVPARRVNRPQLDRRLNAGLQAGRPLCLVSAPAGFGKTVCVSQWLHTLDAPNAWLALDSADDDPLRFFTYFVAALQKLQTGLGEKLEGVLRSGQLPPAESICTLLINDLALKLPAGPRCVLVLDDFHLIQERLILEVIEKLVINLPAAIHLVLLSREDPSLPLARLRANNQLTEIRAAELRFDGVESERFLNEVLGLALSPVDVAALKARTEGWVVGLQLAGLSVRERPDPSAFIAGLSGSHHYFLGYLTEEVLNRQPEEVRNFLLQTAILERFNGDLCNALTGRSDGESMLQRCFEDNLFLIPLDDEHQWYRYHHLFAGLLRKLQSGLPQAQAAALHRRASLWLAEAGQANEAIAHALAAADYELALRQLEKFANAMVMQGYVKTVQNCLQAIPPAWSAKSPRTNLAFARMYLMLANPGAAMPYVQRLQAIAAGDGETEFSTDAALRAEWLGLQTTLLAGQGKTAEALALGEQALALAPPEDSDSRSLIYMGIAAAYQQLGDYPHTVESYERIIHHGRASGNFAAEILGISGLAQTAILHSKNRLAIEVASQGIARLDQMGLTPPISAGLYGTLGQIYYQQNQIEKAESSFTKLEQLSSLCGFSDLEIFYILMHLRLAFLEGNQSEAEHLLEQALEIKRALPPVFMREEIISLQVRLALAAGHPAAAAAALAGDGFTFDDPPVFPDLASARLYPPLGTLANSALRILLYQGRAGQHPELLRLAVDQAGSLVTILLAQEYRPVVIETLLLRAQLQAALGQAPVAQADLELALTLGEPETYLSVFLEEGRPLAEALSALPPDNLNPNQRLFRQQILTAFASYCPPAGEPATPAQANPGGAPPESLLEPLTERELDVLRWIALGLKYEEIAEKCFISLNTVRSHVRVIYAKLNANNRTRAIEEARRLNLL